ncbi:hypothetical protein GCM10011391_30880 [Pullulanibacillus camelliae]|uniref:Uncharacterized protein n=1 Tax=Pullulanibacillus camelliae TaxID=1707096 RepID=A0A8J2YL44_9BACL|nr:hypothetical protein GCM10011391_30880 [Pullulanibacillus camelliae]
MLTTGSGVIPEPTVQSGWEKDDGYQAYLIRPFFADHTSETLPKELISLGIFLYYLNLSLC